MLNKKQGFTLVELLISIAIIGMLASLAVVGVRAARSKTNSTKVQHDIETIRKAMEIMANDTRLWPGGQDVNEINTGGDNEICGDGCSASLASSTSGIITTDGSFPGWVGPYMDGIPRDPWGSEYFFDTDYRIKISNEEPCNGAEVSLCQDAAVLGSYGPNRQKNNQYDQDDIIKVLAK
jgi:general secretion pathway protein G